MKKKLLILGMAACLSVLTACGARQAEETETAPLPSAQIMTEAEATELGGQLPEYFDMIIDQGLVTQLPADTWESKAVASWSLAKEEMGAFQEIVSQTADIGADEATINVNVQGESHEAVITVLVGRLADGTPTILEATTNVTLTFGEKINNAFLNMLLGMGTTFAVLTIIIIVISFFKVLNRPQGKPEQKPAEEDDRSRAIDQTIAQIVENEEIHAMNPAEDSELIAVIAAAIAAAQGASSPEGFRVRSIRKVNASKWKQA